MHYQFYNYNILLLINEKGEIKKLYTPFRVQCLEGDKYIPAGAWVYVDEVCSTETDLLCYAISGRIYLYHHFSLPVKF